MLLHLVLESHGALGFEVLDDYDSALGVVPELSREASDSFWSLRDALLAVDVRIGQESHLARGVGAWEMECSWTLLLALVRAENGCSCLLTEVTLVVLELVVGEVEVVELSCAVTLLLAFLYLLGPHGTVNVHELIYLEWDESTCDGSFSAEAAQQAV